MKVAVGLRRVAAGKRTSGRRAAQIAIIYDFSSKLAGVDFFKAKPDDFFTIFLYN